jgi:signal transduction histidine kinase
MAQAGAVRVCAPDTRRYERCEAGNKTWILLQFADYAKTGEEEEPVVADFNQVVADVCHRYIAVGKDVRATLLRLPGFAFRPLTIRRLVTNLVDNAARYAGGLIEVESYWLDGQVTLRVIDRGPGIQSGDPNSLIKPFAREDIARGSQLRAGRDGGHASLFENIVPARESACLLNYVRNEA